MSPKSFVFRCDLWSLTVINQFPFFSVQCWQIMVALRGSLNFFLELSLFLGFGRFSHFLFYFPGLKELKAKIVLPPPTIIIGPARGVDHCNRLFSQTQNFAIDERMRRNSRSRARNLCFSEDAKWCQKAETLKQNISFMLYLILKLFYV